MYLCFSSYADKEQLGVGSEHPQLCICMMLYVIYSDVFRRLFLCLGNKLSQFFFLVQKVYE